MFLAVICIVILVACVIKLLRRPTITIINVHETWSGPLPTKRQQEQAKQRIFSIIEEFPDGVLAKNYPEYVDEYLNSIELDLPEGITTEK